MATNCECDDANDLSGPGNCCPPEEASVNALLGVNRNCETRRIIPVPKTVLGVNAQGKTRHIDGSDANPLILAIARKLSGDGGVLIQSTEGRVLSVIPSPESDPLPDLAYFGISGGELKFIIPSNADLSWADDEVPTVVNGILSSFTCGGDGRLKLAKWGLDPDNPIPLGEQRYLVMNADGTVSYVNYAFDDCMSQGDEAIVDGLLACKDGKIVTITPDEDEFIKGTSSGVTSAELLSGVTMFSPPVTAYNYSGSFTNQTASYDLALASVPAEAKAVIIKSDLYAARTGTVSSTNFLYTLFLSGELACRTLHRGDNDAGDTQTNDLIIPYPSGGILQVNGTASPASISNASIAISVLVKGYFI